MYPRQLPGFDTYCDGSLGEKLAKGTLALSTTTFVISGESKIISKENKNFKYVQGSSLLVAKGDVAYS